MVAGKPASKGVRATKAACTAWVLGATFAPLAGVHACGAMTKCRVIGWEHEQEWRRAMSKGIYVRQAGVAIYVHAAWATWDRLPLLTGDVERAAHRALAAKCHDLGAEVVALGGIEDHVHLLVKLPATLPLANLIGQIKGASSHLITHLPGGGERLFKWQGAYGAVSVSPQALEDVSAYIAHQRTHHAAQTLLAEWEPPAPREP